MTPEIEFGEIRYPTLLKRLAEGDMGVAVLLADDWHTMESYRPSCDYVFVKFGNGAFVGCLSVASRGWHPASPWYGMKRGDIPLLIDPYAWKPIPWSETGFASCRDYIDAIWPPAPPWVRPPERVFEPAGTDARLTPAPIKLLESMRDGAALREHVWNWTNFKVTRPGQAQEKVSSPPVDRLRENCFIERVGTLPTGHPRKMMIFDWKITAAGYAWLAANDGMAARERRRARAAKV